MAKLTRITLGSIDNLVDGSGIVKIGRGTITASRWKERYLKLATPEETSELNSAPLKVGSGRDDFLAYVDRVLSGKKMYLADVEYKAGKWAGFFPHRLNGEFYKEKTE